MKIGLSSEFELSIGNPNFVYVEMILKGQAAIEYLTTYGWMILVVGLAMTALYPQVEPECKVEVREDFRSSGLLLEKAELNKTGDFHVVLDSNADENITIKNVSISGNNQFTYKDEEKTIDPGSEIIYQVGEAERDGQCRTYELNLSFDRGLLENQTKKTEIDGALKFK